LSVPDADRSMIDDSTSCLYQKEMSQKNHVPGGRALEATPQKRRGKAGDVLAVASALEADRGT
jgi:hypothetical protein